MTIQEKDMWIINIENTASIVASKYSPEVVDSIFHRFDACGIHYLNHFHYPDVFGDLEVIANNN